MPAERHPDGDNCTEPQADGNSSAKKHGAKTPGATSPRQKAGYKLADSSLTKWQSVPL
jgi:hypothetical protein